MKLLFLFAKNIILRIISRNIHFHKNIEFQEISQKFMKKSLLSRNIRNRKLILMKFRSKSQIPHFWQKFTLFATFSTFCIFSHFPHFSLISNFLLIFTTFCISRTFFATCRRTLLNQWNIRYILAHFAYITHFHEISWKCRIFLIFLKFHEICYSHEISWNSCISMISSDFL